MFAEKFAATVSIAATTGTAYTDNVTGEIAEIRYVKAATGFADGATITITGESTGTPILAETGINASATRAPRRATCNTSGVALTFDGTEPVPDRIVLVNERVKIVVTDGGDGAGTRTGTFYVVMR